MVLLSSSLLNEPVSANCLNSDIMNANIVASEITCTSRLPLRVLSGNRKADIKSVRAFNVYMTNQILI